MRLPILSAITRWVSREYYLGNRDEYVKYAKMR